MDKPKRIRMTSEQFLAWEAGQELKWEFDGERPVAMNGGTTEHSTIQGNVIMRLRAALRGGSCRAFGPDLRVATGEGRYRYPDAVVTCVRVPVGTVEITDPVVIFEVLSAGTARTDRTVKLVEYRSIHCLRRYVMLEQDQALATVITRTEHGWSIDVLRDGEVLAMPEIGIEVAVADLYVDVDFPEPPE